MQYSRLAIASALSLVFIGCATQSGAPKASSAQPEFVRGVSRGPVPTPAMALQTGMAINQDGRNWEVKNLQGSREGILAELVPTGDSIKNWKEMQASQILLTKQPLREHVDEWKARLAGSPNSTQKETVLTDGAILVEYEAPAADEIGIRKFMAGPDGIYAFAYHVRQAYLSKRNYELWKEIVSESKFLPNPELKR